MKQIGLRKFAIATSALAFSALFSVGWSGQGGLSLSVDTAQAQPRRLYVSRILLILMTPPSPVSHGTP